MLEAMGNERLEALRLRGPEGGICGAGGVAVCVYRRSARYGMASAILSDEKGFVLAGPDLRVEGKLPGVWREAREPFLLESSVPGVFVAGDVRHGSVKRAASAVGEGSIAVQFVHQYLAGFHRPPEKVRDRNKCQGRL